MRLAARTALFLAASLGLAACSPPGGARSLLVVTLDTTRADRLGCYGRAEAGTPAIDALAERGALFERAYTTVPITLPAHASLLTGTRPTWNGVRDNGLYEVAPGLVTLAEHLSANGFATGAVVAAFPLFADYGLDQGFDFYDDRLEPRPQGGGRHVHERAGDEVIALAKGWLARRDAAERIFLWAHLFDPHHPYEPPEPFAERFAGDPYQGEIAFADRCVGELLDELERLGRADDTLVVVAADHGEGLGEHDEETHSMLVYDATVRVPLVLAGPGVPAGTRVGAVASLVDVVPTACDLLGLPPLDARIDGTSLAPLLDGTESPDPGGATREAYVESVYPRLHHAWSELAGIVRGEWKLAVAVDAVPPAAELYRIVDDPREERDLADERPEVARDLRARLDALRGAGAGGFDGSRAVDPEELARLAALGYAEEVVEPAADAASLPDPRPRMRVVELHDDAKHLLMGGVVEGVEALLDEIGALDPGGTSIHELRGLHLRLSAKGDRERLAEARRHLVAATERTPERKWLWRQLSTVEFELGLHAEALRSMRACLDLAPPTPQVASEYRALVESAEAEARRREARGEPEEARRLWAALAEVEPGEPRYARAAGAPDGDGGR